MFQQTPQKRVLFPRTLALAMVGGFVVLTLFAAVSGFMFSPEKANAATISTVNFQARLENNVGSIVADGFYNVQFKLYDGGTAGGPAGKGAANAGTGSTYLWTETYYDSNGVTAGNDNRIQVRNGYLTANLGSQTAFPSVNWNEELWITMNVGGVTQTATPTWDGEMNPRLKLTGVPYAFMAGQLATANAGGTLTSTLSILQPTVGNQIFQIQDQAAAGTYNLCIQNSSACGFALSSGNANYIQNQNALQQASSNFWLSGIGRADSALQAPLIDAATAVALNIGTTNATVINLNENVTVATGKTITMVGDITANRPASPTAGMLFFDQTTGQLLTYNGSKWQADRDSNTKIVAASNSSQAAKDAADYVADGTSDETEINAALTAAAGGRVYLVEGTYTAAATILVPNNTTLMGAGIGSEIQLADLDATDNLIENTDTVTGGGITIRDLKINGRSSLNTAGTQHGIYLNGMGASTGRLGGKIENVQVHNFRNSGIYLTASDANIITGNFIRGNGEHGIYVTASTYVTVSNNIAEVNSSTGITLNSTQYSNVTGNNLLTNSLYGIQLSSSSYTVVSSNMVYDTTLTGIYASSGAQNSIISNTVSGSSAYGIQLGSTSFNNVSSNSVRGNSTAGIYFTSSSNNNMVGNKLHTNGGNTTNESILLSSSDSNNITGNSISDTSATTNNYAINISNAGSDTNYLADNTLGGGSINNLGTGTIYANQVDVNGNLVIQSSGSLVTRLQSGSSADLFQGQNSGGTPVMKITSTGIVQSSAIDTLAAGTLSVGEVNATTINIATNAVAHTIGIGTGGAVQTITVGSTNSTSSLLLQAGTGNLQIQTQGGTLGIANNAIAQTVLIGNSTGATAITVTSGTGGITLNGNVTVSSGKYINFVGDITANRPASPTAGMLFYDQTTAQLLTYTGSKWQADRDSNTKIVAASNSSQAAKDSADIVVDGNTIAAADGDQVQINTALTASAGGRVFLLEGTYVIDDTILIPNNTTLMGVGSGTLIELADLDVTENMIENSDTTTGTGVTIQGLKLDARNDLNTAGTIDGIHFTGMGGGTGSTARQGAKLIDIIVVRARDDNIELNTSNNNTLSGVTVRASVAAGIYLTASHYNTITGSNFQGNNGGISISASNSNTVTGNNAQGNTNAGFSLGSASNGNSLTGNSSQGNVNGIQLLSSSANNTVSGNTSQGNTQWGIILNGTVVRNSISSNTTRNNGATYGGIGLFAGSSENTITGNNSTGDGAGIYLNSSLKNTISANTINTSANAGIILTNGASDNSITGNTSASNIESGIHIDTGVNNNTISGNRIIDNYGTTFNDGMFINGSNNIVVGNIVSDTSATTANRSIYIFSSTAASNYLADNILGTGNITDNGTTTIYGNQLDTSGVLLNKSSGGQLFQSITNSTDAFKVQNASGESLFWVDTASVSTNLLTNPGFERGATGWIATGTGASATQTTTGSSIYSGEGAYAVTLGSVANTGARITATGITGGTQPAGNYVFSFYAKGSVPLTGLAVSFNGGGTCTLNDTTVDDAGYWRHSCGLTTTGATTQITITATNTAATLYLDNVKLQTGSVITNYSSGQIHLAGVVTSPLQLQNRSNSEDAFSVRTSSGSTIMAVNTAAGVVEFSNLGTSSGGSIQMTSPGTNVGMVITSPAGNRADIQRADNYFFLGASTTSGQPTTGIYIENGAAVCVNTSSCTATGLGVSGTIRASGTITASVAPDIAEHIPTAPDVEAADVVMADPNETERVVKASGAYNGAAVGVIADGRSSFIINPYATIDGADTRTDTQPLVLAGRVPVKVTNEGGPIRPGDNLTTSSTPGHAMKATRAGSTIGKALGFFDGTTGTVLVMVNASYYDPNDGNNIQATTGSIETLQANTASFGSMQANTGSFAALTTGNANIGNLTVAGNTTTQTLTVTGNTEIQGELEVKGLAKVGKIVVSGHIITSGVMPGSVIGAAIGQPNVIQGVIDADTKPSVVIEGNDTAGTLIIKTGAIGLSSGILAHIQFAEGYEGAYKVVISASNNKAGPIAIFVNKTTGGFDVLSEETLDALTEYRFDYITIGADMVAQQ